VIAVVNPSVVSGVLTAPPSKSYTHRAVAIATLSTDKSVIRNPLLSRDTLASVRASEMLGAAVESSEGVLEVEGPVEMRCPEDVVNVENSGTTLRIYTALAALAPSGYTVLTGDESIRRRPMGPLLKSLNELGVECWSTRGTATAPVIVKGGCRIGGRTVIKGGESSQYITALILMGLRASEPVEVVVEGELVSKPYVEATLRMVELCGCRVGREGFSIFRVGPQRVSGIDFNVPGDYSSAAFIVAAAHLTKGTVKIQNLDNSLPQADSYILKLAEAFGSKVIVGDREVTVHGGREDVSMEISLRDCPDLLPVTAVMAACNVGRVAIKGVAHARLKESDRVSAVAEELRKLGVRASEMEDGLVIEGRGPVEGGVSLDSRGDHRLFMAFTVLGLAARKGLKISGAETADVSYPGFLDDLKKIGAEIKLSRD
jgi:3-phosphoshikimate 1-carboxyvinyltransferase